MNKKLIALTDVLFLNFYSKMKMMLEKLDQPINDPTFCYLFSTLVQ